MPESENISKGNKFQTYRETPEAIFVLSQDGESWIPIPENELVNFPWIVPQLYNSPD